MGLKCRALLLLSQIPLCHVLGFSYSPSHVAPRRGASRYFNLATTPDSRNRRLVFIAATVADDAASTGTVADSAAAAETTSPPQSKPDVQQVSRAMVVGILTLLVFQNAGASLVSAAVRKTTPYDGASVALLQEFGKVPLILCAFWCFRGKSSETLGSVFRETFSKSALDLAFPSCCFAIQNVLYFTALRHLDAATYSVLSQSKTAFTAFFFVTVLKRALTKVQILAIGVLMAGMALVQLGPAAFASSSTAVAAAATATPAAAVVSTAAVIGASAVLASSFFSGLANIVFEKLVKLKTGSLYAKQLQLGFWTGMFTVVEIVRRSGVGGLRWGALTQGHPGILKPP